MYFQLDKQLNAKYQTRNRIIHKTKHDKNAHTQKRGYEWKKLDKLNTSISSFIRQDGTNGNCLSLEKKSSRVAWRKKSTCNVYRKRNNNNNNEKNKFKQTWNENSWPAFVENTAKIEWYFLSLTKNVLPNALHFLRDYLGCTVSLGPIQNGHFIVRNEIDRKRTNKHAKRTALK